MSNMPAAEWEIDDRLVRSLLTDQFPSASEDS